MPSKLVKLSLPQHWSDFLEAAENKLKEPVILHCLGGFVVEVVHGIHRRTGDLDYINYSHSTPILEEIAGQKSKLAQKHNLCLQMVAVVDYPDDYEKRLRKLNLGLKMLQLFVLDPYDLILTKLTRNHAKDREDVKAIAKSQQLRFNVLKKRYQKEMKPWVSNSDKHDLTLRLWKEFFPN